MSDLRQQIILFLKSLAKKIKKEKSSQLQNDIEIYSSVSEYVVTGFLTSAGSQEEIIEMFEYRYDFILVGKDRDLMIKLIEEANSKCSPLSLVQRMLWNNQ